MRYKLKELGSVSTGNTPSKSNKSFYNSDDIGFVKPDILSDSSITESINVAEYVSENARSKARMVKDGAVFVTCIGSIGKIGIADREFAFNQQINAIQPNNRVISKYLAYCMLYNKKVLQAIANAPVVPIINKSQFEEFEIEIEEDINEQIKIVEILDKVSRVLASRKAELEKLDDLIKARFVELFGDPSNNPNSFNVVTFNDCVEYMGDIGSNGANKVVVEHLDMKDEEDYALMVRFLNFSKNDFTDDVKYVSKEAYDFFKKSQIFGGELIICKIGSAGQNYVMPYLNRPVSLGLNQIMVRINEKTIMPYLYQYLNTDYGKQLVAGCINGAVTKSITKTELKKIPVIVPPMELQEQFAAFIEQTDKSKVVVQKALDEAQLLFDSLMQKYFG